MLGDRILRVGALIPEITIADFARGLRASGRRAPLEGTIETTYRCNLRCAHCYVNEAAGDAAEAARELGTERLKSLVDEVADRGCLFLLLTGGEVLVRPDFKDIYLHARSRGLLVIVYTNGTMVTEAVADLLAEHKPQLVEISLYGMTRETYEKVTQVPGSYDKCLLGIERLIARGVPLKLKTMALTWNAHEIPAMQAFAESRGLGFRFDSFLNPRVDCGANRNGELQLSAEQAVALDLQNPARLAELRDFMLRYAMPKAELPQHDNVYSCGAGETGFTVDPYGQLQLCQLSRKHSVDVGESSFARGWDEDLPRFRARPWQRNSVCRACNLLPMCASCPGAAEMESGDIEKPVPVFCAITHRRAFLTIGAACGHLADASCCLGEAQPEPVERGCGSGCGQPAALKPALVQLQLRRVPAPA